MVITGLGNGLVADRRQAITWTNYDLLLMEPLDTKCKNSVSKWK